MKRVIEHTADGSATLFVPELDEHYHSIKGARTESQHVFVEMGMKHHQANHLHIMEVGLGTGLNAYLTLKEAQKSGRTLRYTALERYPLQWQTVGQLNFTDDPLFKALHDAAWETEVTITPEFTLIKKALDFTGEEFKKENERYDIVYFDAFAPEKQPEMWDAQLFEQLFVMLNEGGILTTYCAKGVIRRMLQAAGFIVERLPGPPGGKREILRGTKQRS